MLHLIVQLPVSGTILARIASGDDVVLQQRAVWSAVAGHVLQTKLERLMANQCRLYVLRDDMETNGIVEDQLVPGVDIIDYPGLVELSLANEVSKTWS